MSCHTHTNKETQSQSEVSLKPYSTALVATVVCSKLAQLTLNITMQTLRLTHKLNLRLIGVSGGAIAK